MEKKVNGLGVADILIIGAELLSDQAESGDVEVSTTTRLASTGKKYIVTLSVEIAEDDML